MFFGGKGGVGKTTCAAAWAVAAARAGRRVLAVSTDPAHSLGDALGVHVSSRATTVPHWTSQRGTTSARAGLLRAVELDAPRAFTRWLGAHRRALADIFEHGTWLDRQDVDALLGLSIPGVDELVGVLEIARLAAGPSSKRSSAPGDGAPGATRYDVIVVDSAPTGHMLRFVAAPETVANVAGVLADLEREHQIIREQLARVGRAQAADHLIDLLTEQARHIGELLRDPARTTFQWVTLPESLSLAETEDALGALEAARLHVSALVVNRRIPDGPPCPICDRRRAEEHRVLARARRTIARGRALRVVDAQDHEPRGVKALAKVGRVLLGTPPAATASGRRVKSARRSFALSASDDDRNRTRLPIQSLRAARLLFVGGKGGVGKTTTAAALAVTLARDEPERRVLLLSTDPAHSLGDVFDAKVGDAPGRVEGGPMNLYVRELDPAAALAARRVGLDAAIDEIAAAFGAGILTTPGSRGVGELMDLAPPGIDELFGLVSVMDLLSADRYDLVVVDTAPTGHALRLLEMPESAREWVQTLLRMLLKYRNLVRPGQLAAELLELSKSIRALQELMRTSSLAGFIVVTRAAEVPRLETERLLARLKRLGLSVPVALVNAMTLAPGQCRRCRSTAAAERRELARLAAACHQAFRDCVIIQTPLTAPPPRGVDALERWARAWTS